VAEDRANTFVRFPRSVLRSVAEYADLLQVSKNDAITLLIQAGFVAECKRLGIDKDPAAMARDLLRSVGAAWEGDLSCDELDAFGVAQNALNRIADIRSREPR
jgi:hypothetical protein